VLLFLVLFLIAALILAVAHTEGGPITVAIGTAVALALAAVLFRFDISRALGRLDAARAGLPVIVFSLVAVLMGPTPGTTKFDEIGAQVIVVLLLALAVDARFFRLQVERDRLDTVAVCFTMIVLAVGEYNALRGLLTGHPRHSEIVAGAIAAGFVAVAITALAGPSRKPDSKRD
jgi:drug/metabolite transporter superfamily protein YnfA